MKGKLELTTICCTASSAIRVILGGQGEEMSLIWEVAGGLQLTTKQHRARVSELPFIYWPSLFQCNVQKWRLLLNVSSEALLPSRKKNKIINSSFFLFFYMIYFYVHWRFACMHVCVGCQIPWDWSYSLWAVENWTWVLWKISQCF